VGYFKNEKRTFKREIAVVLLLWLMYVVETKDASTIEILVWPVFTFAALSFGLQWFGNNSNGVWGESSISSDRGRAKRGSSSSDGQGEQSGSGKPDNPD
jgi:hypothetical protein